MKGRCVVSTPSPIVSRVALENHEVKSTVTDSLSDVTRRSFHIVLNYNGKGNENVKHDEHVPGMTTKTKGTILPSQRQTQKSE
jgi:hypothetical protein